MFISRTLVLFAALAVGLASPAARDVTKLNACLDKVKSEVDAVSKSVNDLNDSSSDAQIEAIGPQAQPLPADLDACRALVAASPPTSTECVGLSAKLLPFDNNEIKPLLNGLDAKKFCFAKVESGIANVKDLLEKTDVGTQGFITELAKACPNIAPDLKAAGSDLHERFEKSIANYSQ